MKTVICIDAGHGGKMSGAAYTYDGKTILEKDLNLQIALKLEQELLKYKNVEIIQTRRDDISLELGERTQIAHDKNADYLISLHNNAAAQGNSKPNGCTVLVTQSHYQPEKSRVPNIYESSNQLGLSIVKKLTNLGIHVFSKSGLYHRLHTPEEGASKTLYYPDGSVCDYYYLIRVGIQLGIPSIIIEHAFLSNEQDYRNFLSNEEQLGNLAKADAEGIAEALELTLKNDE